LPTPAAAHGAWSSSPASANLYKNGREHLQ
jgi:hypothetical protein